MVCLWLDGNIVRKFDAEVFETTDMFENWFTFFCNFQGYGYITKQLNTYVI